MVKDWATQHCWENTLGMGCSKHSNMQMSYQENIILHEPRWMFVYNRNTGSVRKIDAVISVPRLEVTCSLQYMMTQTSFGITTNTILAILDTSIFWVSYLQLECLTIAENHNWDLKVITLKEPLLSHHRPYWLTSLLTQQNILQPQRITNKLWNRVHVNSSESDLTWERIIAWNEEFFRTSSEYTSQRDSSQLQKLPSPILSSRQKPPKPWWPFPLPNYTFGCINCLYTQHP